MAKTATVNKPQATPNLINSNSSFKIAGRTFSFTPEEKICTALLAILILLVYTIRSKFLLIPFERDEGIYCYMGKLLLEGKVPYVDFYEIKFPGLFYFYAFIIKLFGDSVAGVHRGFIFVNIITLLCVYHTCKNLFTPIAGIIGATTFALVSLTPNLSGFTVQSEHGVALFIALGALFYSITKIKKSLVYYFLFGASLCMAVMIKQTAVFVALWGGLMLLIDFIFTKERNLKSFIKACLAFVGGAVLIVVIFFGIVYFKGGYKDMIYFTFEHTRQYSKSMPLEEGMKYFKYTRDAIVKDYSFFWIQGILSLLVLILPGINIKLKLFGITFGAACFLTIVPGYFFYGHYWIQLVPGLAIVSALTFFGITKLLENRLQSSKKYIKYAYLALFSILTFKHINANKSYYFHPNYTGILRAVYGNNPFPESMEIANYINQNAKPEDNIVLIGSEPQIYFYTKKKAPSRHAYFTAVVNSGEKPKIWQKEYIAGIEKVKPRYIVFFNHQFSLLVQPGADQYVFEWANKYIPANYKVVGYADMINEGYSTNYVWGEQQAATYKPQSPMYAIVFERKTP
jgi:hypothetical protein